MHHFTLGSTQRWAGLSSAAPTTKLSLPAEGLKRGLGGAASHLHLHHLPSAWKLLNPSGLLILLLHYLHALNCHVTKDIPSPDELRWILSSLILLPQTKERLIMMVPGIWAARGFHYRKVFKLGAVSSEVTTFIHFPVTQHSKNHFITQWFWCHSWLKKKQYSNPHALPNACAVAWASRQDWNKTKTWENTSGKKENKSSNLKAASFFISP